MTAKAKAKMKEIMKEILMKQIGCFTPGQNGWSDHVDNCIAAEMFPKCGDDLFIDEAFVDKGLGKITFSECCVCDWKNYDYEEFHPQKQSEIRATIC